MALWLNRAGRRGEFETKFLEEGRIYLTWGELNCDLSKVETMRAMYELLSEIFPDSSQGKRTQNNGQIWSFSHRMQPGDWVALPSKMKRVIHIGEITGPYVFDPQAESPYYHYRQVDWIARDIPRSNFDKDILLSLGAATTICGIKRNDAEKRIRAMKSTGWKSMITIPSPPKTGDGNENGPEDEPPTVDLEQLGRDEIANLIMRKFKGHGMELLVEEILKAQGYTTYRSPEGPDKGVDILASPGPLGFGQPRICVQVKSADAPVDRPTLDQLLGTMQNVQADQGLLVSWSGFKSSVNKETAHHFFRVRLWDQDELIEQFLEHYNNIDEDLRAELPLKRIWTVAAQEEEN